MNIRSLMNLGRRHLKQHLPTLYRQLHDADELDDFLETAAKRTSSAMNALIKAGFSSDEAWQMTRESYLILRPDEEDGAVSRRGSRRSQGIFRTLTEMSELRSRIEENDDEEPTSPPIG